uniref:basic proline-rich protein-like n=1 Tax=Lonchura striata TaxID=40157 RepID=UPI000B4C683C|nr:basic proline-rich protein-like [Lonchura striata domestica]
MPRVSPGETPNSGMRSSAPRGCGARGGSRGRCQAPPRPRYRARLPGSRTPGAERPRARRRRCQRAPPPAGIPRPSPRSLSGLPVPPAPPGAPPAVTDPPPRSPSASTPRSGPYRGSPPAAPGDPPPWPGIPRRPPPRPERGCGAAGIPGGMRAGCEAAPPRIPARLPSPRAAGLRRSRSPARSSPCQRQRGRGRARAAPRRIPAAARARTGPGRDRDRAAAAAGPEPSEAAEPKWRRLLLRRERAHGHAPRRPRPLRAATPPRAEGAAATPVDWLRPPLGHAHV